MGYSSGTKLYPREYLLYEPECVEVQSSCRCGAIAFWRRLADGEPRHRNAADSAQSRRRQPRHRNAADSTQSRRRQPRYRDAADNAQSCRRQPRYRDAADSAQSCRCESRHCDAADSAQSRLATDRHNSQGIRLWYCYNVLVVVVEVLNSSVLGPWREVGGDAG